jgi:2-polyprenyl-3-methyl-5-hydroxy-6-metoxy-1,4-benzoquinol methylase
MIVLETLPLEKEFEKISCPLCGNAQEKFLFSKNNFRIVRCEHCTLVYVNPRLTEKAAKRLYNENVISPMQYYQQTRKSDLTTFKKRWRLIEKFVKNRGKVLDVGCNVGTFLEVAKNAGWDCYGLDINRSVEEECKRKGISISMSSLEKAKFPQEFFDVIILNDVLEHTTTPTTMIAAAHRLLKKEGILFIVTPNIGSVTFRCLGRHWHHLKPNEHLTYFSKKTTRILLKKFEFNILYEKNLNRDRSLGVIIDKLGEHISAMSWIANHLPPSIYNCVFPFSTFDELCLIARKVS